MTDKSAIRVVILDDHGLFYTAVAAWLGNEAPDVRVSYSGDDLDAALAAARDSDVVLLDLDLGANSPPVASLVRSFNDAGARVLVVSALGSAKVIRAAMAAGALGFLTKHADMADLLAGIRAVAAGEVHLTRDLASALAEEPAEVPDFSAQQIRALRLYASGMKEVSVARAMGVRPSTAHEYIKRVKAKYASVHRPVSTRDELRQAAAEDGLLGGDSVPGGPDSEGLA